MKILLIHTGRVGSRALTRALSKILHCGSVEEPFMVKTEGKSREPNLFYFKYLPSRYIVDNVISHASIEFHLQSTFHFDKIILITRKNIKEQAISYAHAWKYSQSTNKWHEPYKDKLSKLTDKEINEQIRILKQANKNLEEIAKIAKLPIFYYEDLFSIDNKGLKYLFKYLDVKYKDSYKNDSFYKLNPKFRYRVFEQTSTTLDNKKKSTF